MPLLFLEGPAPAAEPTASRSDPSLSDPDQTASLAGLAPRRAQLCKALEVLAVADPDVTVREQAAARRPGAM